ncbi:MAG: hypothetical protein H0X28_00240 [Solirubrobacterales bacterium]|nr:hypothetical protein [Solirubrobacterales bacterium]
MKTFAIAVAVLLLGRLALAHRGVFIGLFVLAAMNGIPVLNTSRYLIGHFTTQDLVLCTLLLTVLGWIAMDANPYRPSFAGRFVIGAATLLFTWCVFTAARTMVSNHVGITATIAFARNYLYFAVLLLLLPRVRLATRDLHALLATLTAGVCLFALVQTATAVGLGNPGSLIHVGHTLHQDGLTRVYAEMTDLVTAGLALSLAASLLAPQRSLRIAARPVALLLFVSVVVQLTRARWIGLILAFVLVTLWLVLYSANSVAIAKVLRKRMVVVVGGIVLIIAAVLLIAPGLFSGGPFIERITSIFSDIESSGGTLAVREAVTKTMKFYLGEQWIGGLGFLSPSVHYFDGLPHGSIEDPDLGVLNAIMPMGAIGAALIYLPVVLTLIMCLRRSAGPSRYAWLRYGGAIWIVASLTSSVTLVTLFSTSGLALAAVLLTVLVDPDVAGNPQARARVPARPVPRVGEWQRMLATRSSPYRTEPTFVSAAASGAAILTPASGIGDAIPVQRQDLSAGGWQAFMRWRRRARRRFQR